MAIKVDDIVFVTISKEMLNIAQARAELKKEWMDTWKGRSSAERFQNFLDGQLGEEAVKFFLCSQQIPFTYYDDVRTDDFKEKDEYDFMVQAASGKEYEMSVKSSKLKKDIVRTISENNIIAYPKQVRPYTVQPFIDYEGQRVLLMGWVEQSILENTVPKSLPGAFSDKASLTHQIKIASASPMSELSSALGYFGIQSL